MTYTQLQDAIYSWIDRVKPAHDENDIDLDADLVTGNSVVVTIDGTSLSPVVFTTDHETTMNLIAIEIETAANIESASVGAIPHRAIVVKADAGVDVTVDSFVITGGASQPTPTITRTAWTHGIRWQNQNAPKMDEPFIELLFNDLTELGMDHESAPDVNDEVVIKGDREFVLTVKANGNSAFQDCMDMNNSLKKQVNRDLLNNAGLVPIRLELINESSSVIGTAFQPTAEMDILFRYGQVETDDSRGLIESAEWTGTVDPDGNAIDVSGTVTMP